LLAPVAHLLPPSFTAVLNTLDEPVVLLDPKVDGAFEDRAFSLQAPLSFSAIKARRLTVCYAQQRPNWPLGRWTGMRSAAGASQSSFRPPSLSTPVVSRTTSPSSKTLDGRAIRV
jgi:hypothetical protein